MDDSLVSAKCASCSAPLQPTHTGPCPRCGAVGKRIAGQVTERLTVSENLRWTNRREFFDKNPTAFYTALAMTFGAPLLGFVLSGVVGVAVGLGLAVIAWVLGPHAVTKVREITHGGGFPKPASAHHPSTAEDARVQ